MTLMLTGSIYTISTSNEERGAFDFVFVRDFVDKWITKKKKSFEFVF
jgi:hypothetical protein